MKKIVTLFAGIFCALCLHATPSEVSVQRIQLLPIGADCIGYGQLVIEKDGTQYNPLGTVVR